MRVITATTFLDGEARKELKQIELQLYNKQYSDSWTLL